MLKEWAVVGSLIASTSAFSADWTGNGSEPSWLANDLTAAKSSGYQTSNDIETKKVKTQKVLPDGSGETSSDLSTKKVRALKIRPDGSIDQSSDLRHKGVKELGASPDGDIVQPLNVAQPLNLEGIIKSPESLTVCKSPEVLKLFVNRQLSGDTGHQPGCTSLNQGRKISITSVYGNIVYTMVKSDTDMTEEWNPMWTYKHWLSGNMSLRPPRN